MVIAFCIAVVIISCLHLGANFDDVNIGRSGGAIFLFTDILIIAWALTVIGYSLP